MPEHHRGNVCNVMKWCSRCRKNTLHRVDFKREGSCVEQHAVPGLSKDQERRLAAKEKAEREPTLF